MELQSIARRWWTARSAFGVAVLIIAAVVSYPWPRQGKPLVEASQRKVLRQASWERMDGGGTWRLSEQRGKVVLINYWASWCAPCRTETPGLVRLAKEIGAQRLAVVGVAMDTGDRAPVLAFVRRMGVEYPIVFPEAMSHMAFGMVGLPTTVLVDREGRVAKTYVGETREGEFREDVVKLLRE